MDRRRAFTIFVLCLSIGLLSGCNSSPGTSTGILELTIQGLPSIDADIAVAGPDSVNQIVKTSGKLENLSVGNYVITAKDVVQTDTYFPDKREQSVVIKGGETTSVTLVYSKQNLSAGSLEVTVEGLPVGTNADVSISDPKGFSQSVTTSSVLSNLTPGDYQLTAKTVKAGSDVYTPTPSSQTILVTAGNKAIITVTYTKQSPTLGQLVISITGLPTGLNAIVSVIGPNDFSETLTASKTFENVPPGEYEITASQVDDDYPYRPYPQTQTVEVVAGEGKDAPLGYVPTILPDKGEGAFSVSVAVDGDIMVVGAPAYDGLIQNSVGAAYLYRRAASGEWIFRKVLVPDVQSNDARVGQSVSVSGDTVVVGAPRAITSQECDPTGQNCTNIVKGGLAYVFKRNQGGLNNFGYAGQLQASGVLSPLKDQDNFGTSVAVHDDGNNLTIIVGMPGYDHDLDESGTVECDTVSFEECNVGAAYIYFSNATSSGLKRLLADDKNAQDEFGSAVAISGDTVVVGAQRNTFDGNGDGTEDCGGTTNNTECFIGSAYLFERNQGGADSWGQTKKLLPTVGQFDDKFGASVAIDGDTVALGSDNSDGEQTEALVSVFERDQGGADTWGETKKLSIEGIFEGFDEASVAVHGDLVVVGVPNLNGDVNQNGSVDCIQEPLGFVGEECQVGGVFVFRRDEGGAKNFGLVRTFVATDSAKENNVGRAVAFDGKAIVVGAAGFPVINGAVYVLEP